MARKKSPITVTIVAVVLTVAAVFVGVGMIQHQQRLAEDAASAADFTPAPLPTREPSQLEQRRADGSLSVYFIGDSLTDGWNAATQPEAFRPVVEAKLAEAGAVDVAADYVAGATLATVADGATIPKEAELVVLELGTNDVGTTDLEVFRRDLNALLDRLTASDPILVCLGTYQTGTTGGFDEVIKAECGKRGGKFVLLSDLRETPELVAPAGTPAYPGPADGNHPNSQGHAEIADRILTSIGAI